MPLTFFHQIGGTESDSKNGNSSTEFLSHFKFTYFYTDGGAVPCESILQSGIQHYLFQLYGYSRTSQTPPFMGQSKLVLFSNNCENTFVVLWFYDIF